VFVMIFLAGVGWGGGHVTIDRRFRFWWWSE